MNEFNYTERILLSENDFDSEQLRNAVKKLTNGELLSLYVILEKLGIAEENDVVESHTHRRMITIYRDEVMKRMKHTNTSELEDLIADAKVLDEQDHPSVLIDMIESLCIELEKKI